MDCTYCMQRFSHTITVPQSTLPWSHIHPFTQTFSQLVAAMGWPTTFRLPRNRKLWLAVRYSLKFEPRFKYIWLGWHSSFISYFHIFYQFMKQQIEKGSLPSLLCVTFAAVNRILKLMTFFSVVHINWILKVVEGKWNTATLNYKLTSINVSIIWFDQSLYFNYHCSSLYSLTPLWFY